MFVVNSRDRQYKMTPTLYSQWKLIPLKFCGKSDQQLMLHVIIERSRGPRTVNPDGLPSTTCKYDIHLYAHVCMYFRNTDYRNYLFDGIDT